MITLLEGTPGSGKSYHAIAEYVLPWVRAGRRLYVAIDGFHLDRLAAFEGLEQTDLERQITLWNTSEAIPSLLPSVAPGSAVVLDEAQTIFRAKEKQPGDVLRWLETHRHFGVDVLLLAQDFRQMTSGVTRLVEVTIKFRRMERFGLRRRYQAFVRGNPEETEVIRQFLGKYDARVYSYYSSYAVAGLREERQMRSIASSPLIVTGIVGLVVAVCFFAWGSWLGAAPKLDAKKLPPPMTDNQLHRLESALTSKGVANPPVIVPTTAIRIEGGLRINGRSYWVDDQGRVLSADQIAGLTGHPVTETVVNGAPKLYSTGVLWGGVPADLPIETPMERQPIEPGVEHSPVFQDEDPTPEDVKCIGADGREEVCDGSSRH